jgi:lactoylglutathione lyase
MPNYKLLRNNVTGLQHVGVPVRNLPKSVAFYERLGFERVMSAEVAQSDRPAIQVGMMKLGDSIIELYQLGDDAMGSRADGHVDHIAFNVRNIDEAFRELSAVGISTLEKDPVLLPFWEKGCRYFSIRGPDGEKLEFNQIS